MKPLLCMLLIVIALIVIAVGPSGTGMPSKRPELSGMLNLLCMPQILWCEGMKTVFQKVYPKVTVEFVRLSSGEALTRLRNARANPQFDI
jgi:iron(III) transport system substrate-binding protein